MNKPLPGTTAATASCSTMVDGCPQPKPAGAPHLVDLALVLFGPECGIGLPLAPRPPVQHRVAAAGTPARRSRSKNRSSVGPQADKS